MAREIGGVGVESPGPRTLGRAPGIVDGPCPSIDVGANEKGMERLIEDLDTVEHFSDCQFGQAMRSGVADPFHCEKQPGDAIPITPGRLPYLDSFVCADEAAGGAGRGYAFAAQELLYHQSKCGGGKSGIGEQYSRSAGYAFLDQDRCCLRELHQHKWRMNLLDRIEDGVRGTRGLVIILMLVAPADNVFSGCHRRLSTIRVLTQSGSSEHTVDPIRVPSGMLVRLLRLSMLDLCWTREAKVSGETVWAERTGPGCPFLDQGAQTNQRWVRSHAHSLVT